MGIEARARARRWATLPRRIVEHTSGPQVVDTLPRRGRGGGERVHTEPGLLEVVLGPLEITCDIHRRRTMAHLPRWLAEGRQQPRGSNGVKRAVSTTGLGPRRVLRRIVPEQVHEPAEPS